MLAILVIIGISVVSLAIGLAQQRRVRCLPDTSDETFADYFRSDDRLEPAQAVAERQELARLLGVPPTKIGPTARITDFASRVDPTIRVALGDVEFDTFDLAKKAGRSLSDIPSRADELIRLRLELKAHLS